MNEDRHVSISVYCNSIKVEKPSDQAILIIHTLDTVIAINLMLTLKMTAITLALINKPEHTSARTDCAVPTANEREYKKMRNQLFLHFHHTTIFILCVQCQPACGTMSNCTIVERASDSGMKSISFSKVAGLPFFHLTIIILSCLSYQSISLFIPAILYPSNNAPCLDPVLCASYGGQGICHLRPHQGYHLDHG